MIIKAISIPTNKSLIDCENFWKSAGFINYVHYEFKWNTYMNDYIIIPKIQMILTKDATKFGFKIIEIENK